MGSELRCVRMSGGRARDRCIIQGGHRYLGEESADRHVMHERALNNSGMARGKRKILHMATAEKVMN